MGENDSLADRFVAHRAHWVAVAYRMLGSLSEADDAVQEAWLRLSRVDTAEIDNLGGWLTTTVGRVCLDMLRSRKSRREEAYLPDPIVTTDDATQPEQQAVLADSVGLALLVVLDSLESRGARDLRAARYVRGAVRPDRAHHRQIRGCGEDDGQPRPPPDPGSSAATRTGSTASTSRGRGLPRGRPRR